MKFQSTFNLVLAACALVAYAAPISNSEIKAKAAQGLRLLSLAEGVEPVWKTEDEKLALMRAGKKFVSIILSTLRVRYLHAVISSSSM
jgi:leucyl aminopeptidase